MLSQEYKLLGVHNHVVFPSVDGTPPFSSFIANLGFKRLTKGQASARLNIWDPYCGNGIILRTISVLQRDWVGKLFASDIRESAANATELNIRNCSVSELDKNQKLIDDKKTLRKFYRLLVEHNCQQPVEVSAFQQDVMQTEIGSCIQDEAIDMLITDPPYEYMEMDSEEEPSDDPNNNYLGRMLSNIRSKLKDDSQVGLFLENPDYEETLRGCFGYRFESAARLHRDYKHRFFYRLKTTK